MARGIFDKRIKGSNKLIFLVLAFFFLSFLVHYINSGELANDIAKHGFVVIVIIAFIIFWVYAVLFKSGMGGKKRR